MTKGLRKIFSIYLLISSVSLNAGNSDRKGEAGAYELMINGQARTMGMMGINSANVKGVDALGTNIAGLAHNRGLSVFGNYTSWMSGTETTIVGVGIGSELSPGNNIGFNVNMMSFGKIPLTTTEQPNAIGFFNPYMLNLSLSYARIFGRGVRGGLTGRIINEGINNLSATGFSLDAGLQYTTGAKEDFHFGVFLRNLGFPMQYSGDGLIVKTPATSSGTYDIPFYQRALKFELPAQFSIAVTKDLFFGKKPDPSVYCKPMHRLSLSGNFLYNSFTPNNFGFGFEYALRETFSLRTGFLYEDDALNKDLTTRAHMGVAAGISYDMKLGKKDSKNPPVLEVSFNYRPTWIFNGTWNVGFVFFGSKHSYCDERKIKEVEVVAQVKQVEPEIRYITKYDTIIKQAPPKIETVAEYKKVNEILKNFAGNIEFKYNNAILTDRGEGALMVIGELMRQYPQSRFKIAGHTDNDGDNEKNMRLSKVRARTVARYLTEFKGIPENSMSVEWYGEEKPIGPNNTEDDKQRNRRVEIVVLDGKLEAMSNNSSSAITVPAPPANTPEIEAKRTPQDELNDMASNMTYKPGTDTLTRISKRNIAKIATILKNNPSMKLKVEVHTDNQKYALSNMDLSNARALTIINMLKDEGIDGSRLSHEGFGDTRPVDTNETETGRGKNRRIELKVKD